VQHKFPDHVAVAALIILWPGKIEQVKITNLQQLMKNRLLSALA